MALTPQAIVDALHTADADLDTVAAQYAWFKGQKDFWKARLDYEVAYAKAKDTGPVGKAADAALIAVQSVEVEIPWTGGIVSLPQFVLLCNASFELIAKRWDALEKHIGILQSVNKNLMLDYNRSSHGWD